MRVLLYREPPAFALSRHWCSRDHGYGCSYGYGHGCSRTGKRAHCRRNPFSTNRRISTREYSNTRKISGFLFVTILCGFLTVFAAYRNFAIHSCRTAVLWAADLLHTASQNNTVRFLLDERSAIKVCDLLTNRAERDQRSKQLLSDAPSRRNS